MIYVSLTLNVCIYLPDIYCDFNLLLGQVLKKAHYKPDELSNKLLEQLRSSDRGDCSAAHHFMDTGTIKNAQKKTKKHVFLLAYLLDRWARVPGVRDCRILMDTVFRTDYRIRQTIQNMIIFL